MKVVRSCAKDLLDEPLAKHGGDRMTSSQASLSDKLENKGGTSESYLFRRLKRDRPDLAEKVIAGVAEMLIG